jgi:hypothetical protein
MKFTRPNATKIYYRAHKSWPLDHILCLLNPVCALAPYFSKIFGALKKESCKSDYLLRHIRLPVVVAGELCPHSTDFLKFLI